jgi:hypothetical protein
LPLHPSNFKNSSTVSSSLSLGFSSIDWLDVSMINLENSSKNIFQNMTQIQKSTLMLYDYLQDKGIISTERHLNEIYGKDAFKH